MKFNEQTIVEDIKGFVKMVISWKKLCYDFVRISKLTFEKFIDVF